MRCDQMLERTQYMVRQGSRGVGTKPVLARCGPTAIHPSIDNNLVANHPMQR